jgi:GPH family glycoside/pentoside/hexuronide:cation symporter
VALSRSVALTYSLPSAGTGFSLFLGSIFYLKYATDVLGISAAAMGWILFLSRFWDALSDPIVGFLTDRTRTRLGRRRPWMLASAVPLGLVVLGLWSPPSFLSEDGLVLWVGGLHLVLFTAFTAFSVPYDALGAELTTDYRQRNVLFGYRRFLFGVGMLFAMGAIALLTREDLTTEIGRLATREVGFAVACVAAALSMGLTFYTALRIRERPDYVDRGSRDVLGALRDVWLNAPARLLLSVFMLQQFGTTCITLMAPYFIDYVLRAPGQIATVLTAFMLSAVVSVPLWVAVARRAEKKTILVAAMAVISFTLVPSFFAGPGQLGLTIAVVALAGFASGALDVIFPSLQADVIDVDEHRTGERKEGTYFAVWAFASKTSASLVGVVVGSVLHAAGFVPNAEQSEEAILAIRVLWCGLPIVLWTSGILLFLRFPLGAAEHARIRAEIDARSAAG